MRDNRKLSAAEKKLREAHSHLEKELGKILRERSEIMQEPFVAGMTSRMNLDPGAPVGLRLECVRGEMETLASDLQVLLPLAQGIPEDSHEAQRRCQQMQRSGVSVFKVREHDVVGS